MKNIKKTTALVKAILEQSKQARNSDSVLYLKVLLTVGEQKGIDVESMSIPFFLVNLREYGFPPFESVRRARQKIQALHPELAACESVEAARIENEQTMRNFARGTV